MLSIITLVNKILAKRLFLIIVLISVLSACKDTKEEKVQKLVSQYKQLERDKISRFRVGDKFVMINGRTQGISFDNSSRYSVDGKYIKHLEMQNFSNPDEAGGSETIVSVYETIQKGETEILVFSPKGEHKIHTNYSIPDSLWRNIQDSLWQNMPRHIKNDTSVRAKADYIKEAENKIRDSLEKPHRPKSDFKYQIIIE